MKITIITEEQPYIFEHVTYISVDHEEGEGITQYGNGEGFIIEEGVNNGKEACNK